MSQKESEWEAKLQEKIKENKFVTPSSHLDAEEIKYFIRETLVNREKEIAEEVEEEVNLEQLKRYKDEDSKLAHNSYGAGHSFGSWEMADKILQILKH